MDSCKTIHLKCFMQEHNWKSKTVWLPSSRPSCLSSPHHLKCHTHKQTALRADCLFFRYTMLSIYTKGLKWASIEDRISAQATHHSASQSHICMINTSNNINSPSSSTCQWARTHTHAHPPHTGKLLHTQMHTPLLRRHAYTYNVSKSLQGCAWTHRHCPLHHG